MHEKLVHFHCSHIEKSDNPQWSRLVHFTFDASHFPHAALHLLHCFFENAKCALKAKRACAVEYGYVWEFSYRQFYTTCMVKKRGKWISRNMETLLQCSKSKFCRYISLFLTSFVFSLIFLVFFNFFHDWNCPMNNPFCIPIFEFDVWRLRLYILSVTLTALFWKYYSNFPFGKNNKF